MKERVEEIISFIESKEVRTVNEVVAHKVIKDLWAENQTIVAEYKTLSENHASANQTNRVLANKLLLIQQRDKGIQGAKEPTEENIEAARALIYCHILNEVIRFALYDALDDLSDKLDRQIEGK